MKPAYVFAPICRIRLEMPMIRLDGATMQILYAMFGIITTIFAYTLLFFGVYKIFAIGNDLAEIKKLLSDLAREHDAAPGVPPHVLLRE